MNPEQIAKLEEVYAWMKARKEQQLSTPLDDVSRIILGFFDDGPGNSALTDTITIGPLGGSANVPKAYLGTEFIVINGKRLEIPYLTAS